MSKKDLFPGQEDFPVPHNPFGDMEILDADDIQEEVSEEELSEEDESIDKVETETDEDSPKPNSTDEDSKDTKEQSAEEKKDAVPLDAIADAWIKEGFLSEDFKVPKGATPKDFKNAIYEDAYKPLKEAAEADAEDYKNQLIKEQGLDEATLNIAKNIKQGVSPQTANSENALKQIEAMNIDSDSEEAFNNRETLMRVMYKQKGLSDTKIDKLVEIAQEEGNDLEEAKEAKEYLKGVVQTNIQREKKDFEAKQKEAKKVIDTFNKRVKKLIDGDEILEGSKKESFVKDLYDETEWISIKDEEGKIRKKRTSLWNKKLHELGVTINPIDIKELEGDKLKNFLTLAHTIMYGDVGAAKVKESVRKEEVDKLTEYLGGRPEVQQQLGDDLLEGPVDFNLVL